LNSTNGVKGQRSGANITPSAITVDLSRTWLYNKVWKVFSRGL